MPVSRDTNTHETTSPTRTSTSAHTVTLGLKDSSQVPTKRTLNLCIREKSNISIELFLILLAVILVVVMVAEFFGVFRPYARVESLEAQVNSAQKELDGKNDAIQKYENDKVPDDYHKYNFEGFDLTIADRLKVLDILDRHIINHEDFNEAKIGGTITIRDKTVSFTLEGLTSQQLADLRKELQTDPWVYAVNINRASSTEGNETSATVTLTLNDADKVVEEVQA